MWILLISAFASIYNKCNAQSSFYESFNLKNEFIPTNHTLNVRSTIDTSNDEHLNVSFSFINGRCWNPTLSLYFEEIDFDAGNEYFNVYYPSPNHADIIANCSGHYQKNCGVYTQCIKDYNFNDIQFFEDGEVITLYSIKSAAVNAFCDGYSMNLNVTISCNSERYHIWNEMSNNNDNLPIALYAHIAAFYGSTLTIIGGIHTVFNGSISTNIYSRNITPYSNTNAIGHQLAFESSSSWDVDRMVLPIASGYINNGLVCDGQCYTQIDHILYIFGAHNDIDSGRGLLLQYDLDSMKRQFIAIDTYDYKSNLGLNHVCVANNGSHLWIIGGYNGISSTPFHNIQSYDINNNVWDTSVSLLIEPRIDCGCIVHSNILYIIGGWTMYHIMATNTVEILDLSTMNAHKLNAVLNIARIGHKVLADDKDRLWVIGGRNTDEININEVEILDTTNNVFISSFIPVKYASTLIAADYAAAWYHSDNAIMFTCGGYDAVQVKNDIQYIAVDVIGTDAFPTVAPTLPPVPTPYPTPSGHYIGTNRVFDMKQYGAKDAVSFTQNIQSTEDLGTDSFFYVQFKFINGNCSNASLSFTFEEVDFASNTDEFMDVFYPIYPMNQIAHCTGTKDFNCNSWIKCMDRIQLQPQPLDTSDDSYNYHVTVLKSAEVNSLCGYSINANVTIHCGPKPPPTPLPTLSPTQEPTTPAPTSLYTNISHTFDLNKYTMEDTVSFTIPVQTSDDYDRDSLYLVQFDFINGECNNPRLTFTFEETDFASYLEFIEIYSGTYSGTLISRCTGSKDRNCGTFIECLSQYPLSYAPTDSLQLTLLKSADVGSYMCTYSLNANVTITCGPSLSSTTQTPTTDDNLNITKTFDLSGYTMNDAVSFIVPVQSEIDNGMDALFHIDIDFINAKCHNPTLRFDFEEIDFQQNAEFIGIYSPKYPQDFVKQCTGSKDSNCGHNINCIDHYLLSKNATDSLSIYILKSADINNFCDYSINANISIYCGPPSPTLSPTPPPTLRPTPSPIPPQFAFNKTFDLYEMDSSKPLNRHIINVASDIDNGEDVIFNVTFKFINGICRNPYLSVIFEEIDHAADDEYLEIRYPSNAMYDAIGRCDGDDDYHCNYWEHCLSYYDLSLHNISFVDDEITIYIVKSAQVNKLCNYSINANISITCIHSMMINTNISCPPTPICTPSPTASVSTLIPIKTAISSTIVNVTSSGIAVGGDNEDEEDKLMDYLPWILFVVSVFFNLLLCIALIREWQSRKSLEMRERLAQIGDSTQMVTMHTRAGHSNFQEIISDASVDYVNLAQ